MGAAGGSTQPHEVFLFFFWVTLIILGIVLLSRRTRQKAGRFNRGDRLFNRTSQLWAVIALVLGVIYVVETQPHRDSAALLDEVVSYGGISVESLDGEHYDYYRPCGSWLSYEPKPENGHHVSARWAAPIGEPVRHGLPSEAFIEFEQFAQALEREGWVVDRIEGLKWVPLYIYAERDGDYLKASNRRTYANETVRENSDFFTLTVTTEDCRGLGFQPSRDVELESAPNEPPVMRVESFDR